ncbi:hypothetical protein [Curtobacterium poinsettiae]|uniref:Uncharacterized protein n=1 Tax=Curtobacterium poinsettiae TaxID=159612 RepID=A0ABT3S5M4_9MICO|nr:hypothetical protein [Curtobacterium flaccumfaciens]MBT1610650.1 hypothetical protein [Curtobacterium flaccumfaciens pv. poinsettiae]MCX2850133.1 hypothetical protein [Curtobacterium flaccumfaciens pv. poinsettiae]UXN18323.1 hypothetical protein N8D78_16040 [Curtobacterium flaccumfaciens pv. poinsettiae]
MLQISSGKFFEDPEVWETEQRQRFFTNLVLTDGGAIDLPVGRLEFSALERAVEISAVDRLPKQSADGSESFHVATDGVALLSDIADVVAFTTDAVVLDSVVLGERLTRSRESTSRRRGPRLRRTFEAERALSDDCAADLAAFVGQLVALRRGPFVRAMRAIRRVVDAAVLAESDATLSYSLFVAALESLSSGTEVPVPEWDSYDKRKREVVDAAVAGLPEDRVERVQAAVLQIDQLSLRRKFQAFVLGHVTSSYYRAEASEADNPIRAVDLPRALDFAYQTRSVSLHEMRDLAPELWNMSGAADTTIMKDRWVFTLEGLNRLSRHVIRAFVDRAPTGVDIDHDWQEDLPGIMQVKMSPELWLHGYGSFGAADGPFLFGHTVQMFVAALSGDGKVTDMSAPLERIEELLPQLAKAEQRVPFIATYVLWHRLTGPALHRPGSAGLIDKFETDLNRPSVPALTLGVLLGKQPPWTTEELVAVLDARDIDLRRARVSLELPRRIDAAFRVLLAARHVNSGERELATSLMDDAVLLDPGNHSLIEVEVEILKGKVVPINLSGYIYEGKLTVDDERNEVD